MTVAAGSDTQIQYNIAGNLDASPKLTFDYTTEIMKIGNTPTGEPQIQSPGNLIISGDASVVLVSQFGTSSIQGRPAYLAGTYGDENGAAGEVYITGGYGSHTNFPSGGSIGLTSGGCSVDPGPQGSTTGSITIETPSGAYDTTNTGNITLTTGNSQGAGVAGSITLMTGQSLNYPGHIKFQTNGGYISFSSITGERARITPVGQLLLGTTSPHGLSGTPLLEIAASTTGISPRCFTMSTDSNVQFIGDFWNKSSTSGNFVRFGTGTSTFAQRGSITYSNGTTNYNTTSDAELKEEIVDSKSAGDVVDKIKVRSFKWKDSGKKVDYWVLAQELYPVCPTAVTPGSKTSYWEVDVSKLVPILVKEVQELRARLAKLEKKK